MPAHIVNLDALDFERWDAAYPPDSKPPAERFGADIAHVGRRIGARKLGYNVTSIDPGKAAYPAHAHRVNEEMFVVLEGTGTLRIGAETHPVRAGDIIACPPGGPETAHQLTNTGAAPLKVLMVSTAETVEILHYPDSGKTAFGQRGVGADGKPVMVRGMVRDGEAAGQRTRDDSIAQELAGAYQRMANAPGDDLLIVPDLALVDGPRIFLIKPLIARFWLQRAAIDDAAQLAIQLLTIANTKAVS